MCVYQVVQRVNPLIISIFLLHPINLICVPKFRHIGYRIWHADRHHCQNPQAYKSEYDSALCKNFGSQYQPGNAKNRNGSDCIDSRGTGSKARRTSWSGQEQTSISESEPQKSAFTAFIQELTEICCYSVAESYNLIFSFGRYTRIGRRHLLSEK